MNVIGITALSTNYIWLLHNNSESIVIDPGDALVVLKILKKLQIILKAIFLTHNHFDHIAGVDHLVKYFPNVIVYGPEETRNNNVNFIVVSEGDYIVQLQRKFKVFNFPGHTIGHIGFYSIPWLFCGDTVFSVGCGKVCTGFMRYMYESLEKIRCLPGDTLIFSGHEYTLSNINFAITVLPRNRSLIDYHKKIIKLRKYNTPTVPSRLALELQINPFFLCNSPCIRHGFSSPLYSKETWKIFAELRKKKDMF
ncbi:hydroxyacylglutathione hydrolase [Candidatus Blochmannia ocreatus (nom. nud.)]|uniref:Hydroxyacylglutathione hydrolase n=1 Tax=Candidatus Blochmannia ocreatus (nom. nud.) TaxID=251538 RepID=A0ABY4SYS2_9ENTR|nr:hydroxyacylglutathione hydrolase [Candidatus Blochmannia ocreatus]URJ25413.1 hydroxyacylglutathione hydrolase [Candidatus Blochmannia ocreatus]